MRYKGDKEFSRQNSINNYKLNLEARRGHNYSYMSDELWRNLKERGYSQYDLNGETNLSEYKAKEIVTTLREHGNFARIICSTNRVRITEFYVWYKPKLNTHKPI